MTTSGIIPGWAKALVGQAGPEPTESEPQPSPTHSRVLVRLRRRYHNDLGVLPVGPITWQSLSTAYDTLLARHEPASALRVLRQLVLERLISQDCAHDPAQRWPLEHVTTAMTLLGEFALDVACGIAFSELDAVHGAPMASDNSSRFMVSGSDMPRAPMRSPFWVIGMGKFGARELNVSSDIDLIYVYEHDGETVGNEFGRNRVSNHEYFAKVARRLYQLIGDTTDHGFVFRMDLALRPHGNQGPPVVSLGALEEYLLSQGREWERFAWLKARVVAPRHEVTSGQANNLRPVVLPFVFRKYLDYSVFQALRNLHQQIRSHNLQRHAGRPERANDVKLGRGGIREIEFIVQLLQVVRGGQFPELRTRATLAALPRLTKAGLMPEETTQALAVAYTFLRQVEHRIQYLDDQQTHALPTQASDLLWIAQTMGFATSAAFSTTLGLHRDTVAREFEQLLGPEPGHEEAELPRGPDTVLGDAASHPSSPPSSTRAAADFDGLLAISPPALHARLTDLGNHPRVLALREGARQRLLTLLSRTARQAHAGDEALMAAERFVEWLVPLLRRESYLALMVERPRVHARLLKLLGAARWPSRYLVRHPGVIDELAGASLFDERFSAAAYIADLESRRAALAATQEDDEEELLDVLRRAHHAEVFRTLARDVEGRLTVEQVADDLSALADATLRVTLEWCWSHLRQRHQNLPRIGVIAYGKLGGKELGYGSDLDLVFVHDDPHENAQEIYTALVRKLINWMTVKTGEGDLFEIDTALRPNGNSGLLVTSFAAYADYQTQRGSNTAWTWEHQAITRARCVYGSSDLASQFDAVRQAVITQPRDHDQLAHEIRAMCDRVRAAKEDRSHAFDVKYSHGGMVEVEFAVQYLVLAHSAKHPELQRNLGNIALLQIAESKGLVSQGLGTAAADGYRLLRQVQHRARLDDVPAVAKSPDALAAKAAIQSLWQSLLGSS